MLPWDTECDCKLISFCCRGSQARRSRNTRASPGCQARRDFGPVERARVVQIFRPACPAGTHRAGCRDGGVMHHPLQTWRMIHRTAQQTPHHSYHHHLPVPSQTHNSPISRSRSHGRYRLSRTCSISRLTYHFGADCRYFLHLSSAFLGALTLESGKRMIYQLGQYRITCNARGLTANIHF
jgi:hypothetical protein